MITEQGLEYDVSFDALLGDYIILDVGDAVVNLTKSDLSEMIKELGSD